VKNSDDKLGHFHMILNHVRQWTDRHISTVNTVKIHSTAGETSLL